MARLDAGFWAGDHGRKKVRILGRQASVTEATLANVTEASGGEGRGGAVVPGVDRPGGGDDREMIELTRAFDALRIGPVQPVMPADDDKSDRLMAAARSDFMATTTAALNAEFVARMAIERSRYDEEHRATVPDQRERDRLFEGEFKNAEHEHHRTLDQQIYRVADEYKEMFIARGLAHRSMVNGNTGFLALKREYYLGKGVDPMMDGTLSRFVAEFGKGADVDVGYVGKRLEEVVKDIADVARKLPREMSSREREEEARSTILNRVRVSRSR